MDDQTRLTGRALRATTDTFLNVEHGLYMAIGVVLAAAAVIALGAAAYGLWGAVLNWDDGSGLLQVMDRLLIVLMLAEILHTVRVSIRSGALTCEPFLIVGLIACIRRVLVITLKSSQQLQSAPDAAQEAAFRTSMIELGVLAGLILVMVVSIVMIRRSRNDASASEEEMA